MGAHGVLAFVNRACAAAGEPRSTADRNAHWHKGPFRAQTRRRPDKSATCSLKCRQRSELLTEDEEPLSLLPPRHVSTSLWAALRVLAAPDDQLASWQGMQARAVKGTGVEEALVCEEAGCGASEHVRMAWKGAKALSRQWGACGMRSG